MANIYLRECSDTEVAQKWTAMADGRIALEASSGTSKCSLRKRRSDGKSTNVSQNNVSISST